MDDVTFEAAMAETVSVAICFVDNAVVRIYLLTSRDRIQIFHVRPKITKIEYHSPEEQEVEDLIRKHFHDAKDVNLNDKIQVDKVINQGGIIVYPPGSKI